MISDMYPDIGSSDWCPEDQSRCKGISLSMRWNTWKQCWIEPPHQKHDRAAKVGITSCQNTPLCLVSTAPHLSLLLFPASIEIFFLFSRTRSSSFFFPLAPLFKYLTDIAYQYQLNQGNTASVTSSNQTITCLVCGPQYANFFKNLLFFFFAYLQKWI